MKFKLTTLIYGISTLSFVFVCYYFSSKYEEESKFDGSSREVMSKSDNEREVGLDKWMTKMEKRFSDRAIMAKSACEKHSVEDPHNITLQYYHWQKVMFDSYFKWGFCAVGKVASTTLSYQFKKLMTTKERPDRLNEPFVKYWRTEQMPKFFKLPGPLVQLGRTYKEYLTEYKIYIEWFEVEKPNLIKFVQENNYLLFTFVRHPFERLVSAYKDKIVGQKKHLNPLQVQKYKNLFQKRNAMSFPDFIDLILKEFKSDTPVNGHWNTLSNSCLHCTIPYDVIGKLETFNEDLNYIVLKLGLQNVLSIKDIEKDSKNKSNYKTREKKTEIFKYFSQLTKGKFEELWKIYRIDFEMFGYDASDYLRLNLSELNVFDK